MVERDYPSQFGLKEVPVIIIISIAILFVVMFLIFAKRQIMRFTLRGRRGVQSLDESVPKVIRREIERRLECVQRIAYEPKLVADDDGKFILRGGGAALPPYYYRQRAVDDVKWLGREITRHDGTVRYASDNLRSYLLNQLKGPVNGGSGQQRLIHQFCDMYEHARHDPAEFGSAEYDSYHRMLLKLVEAARALKSKTSSPNRTPTKTKAHKTTTSLLDPARLRPPMSVVGGGGGDRSSREQQGRINMSLGIIQQQLRRRNDLNEDDPFDRIDILEDSPKL